MVEHLPSMCRGSRFNPITEKKCKKTPDTKSGMVAHLSNPITQKVGKEGWLLIPGQSGLHSSVPA